MFRKPALHARSSPARFAAAARLAGAARRSTAARLAAAALPAAVVLAGCGGSHSSTGADPAQVIPSTAPLYVGAIVRPQEPLKAAAQVSARALTHQTDPYLQLLSILQTPGSPPLEYARDVAPWLGPQGGLFLSAPASVSQASIEALLARVTQALLGSGGTTRVTPFGTRAATGAVVLDTSDATKARAFLATEAQHAGAHAAVYRGQAYQVSASGTSFALVKDFVVIGAEASLHGVIDTSLGGPALKSLPAYSQLLAQAPATPLAHLYLDAAALPTTGASGFSGLLRALAGASALNVSLLPSSSAIALDLDALTSSAQSAAQGPLSASPEGAAAVAELPGESWLAIGLGNLGGTIATYKRALTDLASLAGSLAGSPAQPQSSGLISLGGLVGALFSPLSVLGENSTQARREFQSWMGPAGIFASGSGLLELKGAVVIASTQPARSRAAVAALAAELRRKGGSVQAIAITGSEASVSVRLSGLPLPLVIADGRDASGQAKFVIGLGEASVAAALHPPSTLADAPSLNAAAAALGEGIKPSVAIDVPTLVSLLEAAGLSEDPTISPLLPTLRGLSGVAAGSKSLGGGISRLRVTLGLTQSAQEAAGA